MTRPSDQGSRGSGWRKRPKPAIRYRDPSASSAGPGLEGDLLRGRDGYLFRDAHGVGWWVLLADQDPGRGADEPGAARIIACSRPEDGEGLEVRVLAERVSRAKTEEAFRLSPPHTFEEALSLAEGISAKGP